MRDLELREIALSKLQSIEKDAVGLAEDLKKLAPGFDPVATPFVPERRRFPSETYWYWGSRIRTEPCPEGADLINFRPPRSAPPVRSNGRRRPAPKATAKPETALQSKANQKPKADAPSVKTDSTSPAGDGKKKKKRKRGKKGRKAGSEAVAGKAKVEEKPVEEVVGEEDEVQSEGSGTGIDFDDYDSTESWADLEEAEEERKREEEEDNGKK